MEIQHADTNTRTITLSQGIAMYIGAVLGSGILILPGYTAQAAGPSSILAWILLSTASLPIAYSFARLSLKFPHFGGTSVIVRQSFGDKSGAVTGWFFFVWVATGQAVVGFTGAGYLIKVTGLDHDPWYAVIAALFVLLPLLSNLAGIRFTGRFSLMLSGIVLLLLIATIGFSLPAIELKHLQPFFAGGLPGFGQACVLIFWAFFGWESMTHMSAEFRHPERDIMRSMRISVLLIGTLYVLLSFVTVGTHTYAGSDAAAPLAVLMNQTIGISAALATAAITCLVCLGTLNVYVASSARLGHAMAEAGHLPHWFAKLDRHGVPHRSAWFLFATNIVVIALTVLLEWPVDTLILVPTSLGISVYAIGTAACLKLLWRDPVGRYSSLTALICCLAVLPFVAKMLLIPVIVAAMCLAYLQYRAAANLSFQNRSHEREEK